MRILLQHGSWTGSQFAWIRNRGTLLYPSFMTFIIQVCFDRLDNDLRIACHRSFLTLRTDFPPSTKAKNSHISLNDAWRFDFVHCLDEALKKLIKEHLHSPPLAPQADGMKRGDLGIKFHSILLYALCPAAPEPDTVQWNYETKKIVRGSSVQIQVLLVCMLTWPNVFNFYSNVQYCITELYLV